MWRELRFRNMLAVTDLQFYESNASSHGTEGVKFLTKESANENTQFIAEFYFKRAASYALDLGAVLSGKVLLGSRRMALQRRLDFTSETILLMLWETDERLGLTSSSFAEWLRERAGSKVYNELPGFLYVLCEAVVREMVKG